MLELEVVRAKQSITPTLREVLFRLAFRFVSLIEERWRPQTRAEGGMPRAVVLGSR